MPVISQTPKDQRREVICPSSRVRIKARGWFTLKVLFLLHLFLKTKNGIMRISYSLQSTLYPLFHLVSRANESGIKTSTAFIEKEQTEMQISFHFNFLLCQKQVSVNRTQSKQIWFTINRINKTGFSSENRCHPEKPDGHNDHSVKTMKHYTAGAWDARSKTQTASSVTWVSSGLCSSL